MSGRGWEVLTDVWEWSGGPLGCPRVVGRLSHISGRPFRILSTTQCFKQFNRVELHTELMKCSPVILAPGITQQFEQLA